jgi:nucleoside-diphosphate-sugar epimerase
MKILFIGGTGNISSAVSRLIITMGYELWHLSRGIHSPVDGVQQIKCDINNQADAQRLLKPHHWDVVVNWIAFTPNDVERDFLLFANRTKQYIFISSASAYQKPPQQTIITEATPLENPFWDYSRQKIACEQLLHKLWHDNQFPATIVRPSHTYQTVIPLPLGAWNEYTTIDRMKKGFPVVVPGDGTSLWTITHAQDFAIGMAGLIGNTQAIGETYHITSDEAMPWNYYYQMTAKALGVEPILKHIASESIVSFAKQFNGTDLTGTLLGDKSHSAIFDNTKIKKLVPSFQCKIPFKEGIQHTLNWFESHPQHQTISSDTNALFDQLIERY